MRRYVPILIAGSALIVSACRDAVAPTRQETPVFTSALRTLGDRSFAMIIAPGEADSAETVTFTLNPEGGQVNVSKFSVDYPADAVCDPATSGYGPDTWDDACVTLDVPIEITARYFKANGRMHVEFSPDVRFAPGRNVVMSVTKEHLVGQTLTTVDLAKYNMWYAVVKDGKRHFIDESATDASLVTKFVSSEGRLYRRIKHFSWYNVRTGESCDPASGDPTCLPGELGLQ